MEDLERIARGINAEIYYLRTYVNNPHGGVIPVYPNKEQQKEVFEDYCKAKERLKDLEWLKNEIYAIRIKERKLKLFNQLKDDLDKMEA